MVNDKVQHEDKTAEEVSKKVSKVGTEAPQPDQPGHEHIMDAQPQVIRDTYVGADKLKGKVALITGGDSGIGRAVAVHFAREGAKGIAIVYKDEDKDAQITEEMVKNEGCSGFLSLAGDVGDPEFCKSVVKQVVQAFGRLDVLVNNAAEQHKRDDIADITPDQVKRTFATNLFSMFYLSQAAVPHFEKGSTIINSTSVTSYRGKKILLDYSSTKGGISTLTRTLAQLLMPKGIRVNGVAPGPIWTPLIPATFGEDSAADFGQGTPMKRAGQPSEVAPCYVYLASDDSSYVTGTVMHPNGGTVLNT